jgi:sarcosine oxidase, subunit beta
VTSPRTPVRGSESVDVVVIGAGIIGAAIALELSRAGRKVLVVDAGPGPGAGSTGSSSAIIRLHYSRLNNVVAALDSYHDWKSWSIYLGYEVSDRSIQFIDTGALVLDGADTSRSQFTEHFDALGIAYQNMTAPAIMSRFPLLDARSFGPPASPDSEDFWRPDTGPLGGFFYESSGYIDDPQLATRNICASARHFGASFRFREIVKGVPQRANQAIGVELESGEIITSSVVVNAGGPASDEVNLMAGVTADMTVRSRPLRTETHEIAAPDGFEPGRGGTFVTDLDLGIAFRPHGHGRLHISSIEPECDDLEWINDPWQFGERATAANYERQAWRTARRMPTLRVPSTPSGIGALYDVTPDWTPIFDRSSLDGFFLACGTSGNCFKLAPFAGRAMLAIIDAAEDGLGDDAPPIQIRASHLDQLIDLAPFSRRRKLDDNGPRNVIA